MGLTASKAYGKMIRLLRRYNAQDRALKFIEKDQTNPAPHHEVDISKIKDNIENKKDLEELYVKNKQLDEYLKKVYLTSTDEVISPPKSNRPLPIKRVRDNSFLFYEPKIPRPNGCTLSSVIQLILSHSEDPKLWNVKALAEKYKMEKDSVAQLLLYYSVFRKERFDFMDADEVTEEKEEKITFAYNTRLEKIPVKQITDKKN